MLTGLPVVLERLVAPTRTAILAMLATVLFCAVLVLLPAPAFYRLIDNAVSYDSRIVDGEAYLFGRLTRMFAAGPSDFRLAWIGASTTRESLWSEAELAGELLALSGRNADVVDLATSGQPLGLSLALAERAACAAGAKIIVLGVNRSVRATLLPSMCTR